MGRGKPRKTNQKGSAAINRKASDNFLVKNGNREEVTTLGTGLQYEVIKSGNGVFVEYGATLTVDQKVTLIDGSVISDTHKTGEPETFLLKEAIKGYHDGLLLMSVGDTYKFYIPYELAWNKRGTNVVPPFSAIIIECTLLSIDI